MYDEEKDEAGAKKIAPDVTKKANLIIWMYFFLFGVTLWGLIYVVDVYFRMQTEKEVYVKVESVEWEELKELRAFEEEVLSGKKGVVEGKRHVSIDNAINQFLQVIR